MNCKPIAMKHGSLFSGIGGFDLAAEWMGWENVFHCEIAEFPRKVLKYHFPKSICYEDIKKTDFTKHRGEIDIISGGFPCQPYSNAGKRKGKEDDRHLWPEMLRVIREVQPRFVVGENVAGLLSWNNGMVFHEIITDLENEGYETQAFLIPACATNAPHRRDRIWFVAHANSNGFKQQRGYDGSRKNNERSNTSVKWSINSENIDNASSSIFIAKQSESYRRISEQTNGETKEFADSNGICKLDKKFDECKEIECRNKCKIDNSRTLVSKGQSRFQLSNYIGMEFNKANLSSGSTNGHTDDKNGINRMERITPNSNGTEQGNDIGENIGEEGEIRWGKDGDVFGELRGDGNVADTESQRTREQSSEDRGRENRRFDNNGKEWNVADTTYSRLQRRQEIDQWEKHNSKRGRNGFDIGAVSENIGRQIRGDFENFPTQSPICGGDDGISTQLDGITFSKWRNESIKGYGNAVVPQVVYQIFKAIEQSIAE